MSMTRNCVVAAVAAFVAAAAPAAIQAQVQPSPEDDEKARELFRMGENHYAAGRYEKAAVLYEEAYRLSGRLDLLLAMVNTYERMGDYPHAIEYLKKYLDDPRAKNVESLRERQRRLERAQEQRGLEQKRVHDLEDMEKARAAEVRRLRQQARRPAPSDGPVEQEARRAGPSRWPYYLLFGGSALAAGGAVGFGIAARRAGEDIDERCGEGDICRASAEKALDRERRYSLLADVSAAVAIAAGAVGFYLLVTRDDEPAKERSAVRVAPTALPGGGGVVVVGDF